MKQSVLAAALGFLAAALSVLTFHQGILFVFNLAGLLDFPAWSLSPNHLGIPRLLNGMFWGGLWGGLYGLILARRYRVPLIRSGLLLGLAAVVLGNFLLVPLFKDQPLFLGFEAKRIFLVMVIHLGFGLGTAIFFRLLRPLRS